MFYLLYSITITDADLTGNVRLDFTDIHRTTDKAEQKMLDNQPR